MSITKEIGGVRERFRNTIDQLIQLLHQHEISSTWSLAQALRRNKAFREDWNRIWTRAAAEEGGKLTLATAGAILGAALGGVGIAMVGTAFGLPLAAVLGLAGLIAGSEVDVLRRTSKLKRLLIALPRDTYERIDAAARISSMNPNDLIVRVLEESFPPDLTPGSESSPPA